MRDKYGLRKEQSATVFGRKYGAGYYRCGSIRGGNLSATKKTAKIILNRGL